MRHFPYYSIDSVICLAADEAVCVIFPYSSQYFIYFMHKKQGMVRFS